MVMFVCLPWWAVWAIAACWVLIDRLFCFGFMVIGYMLRFDSVWMVVVVYLSVVWLVLMICLGVGCLLLLLVMYC